ncbi:IS256 family transposase [Thermophagus xiamenensis]|jgi:transposase-like protein|uniref:Mutator family transposase n=1 Tax=Thermophagus xiamenensis TaxID=385682 RepID=A0A1I2G474_9BACT|nr:IS256 family transposase [Thermophagus xiamenensis]SFF11929.1 Transposase (or an inactivated derivative) [Thermophagus xiamenensis]
MDFTKEQLTELISKHITKGKGLQDLLELMIESLMRSERREFLDTHPGNKGNGYRQGRSYGNGRVLEFRIPRDRYGNFHPTILALLRDQELECERLAGSLYSKGLTQSEVGEVFEEVYGRHYSKGSISRMIEYLREDVDQWLSRSLESYYPIVFVDAIHIKVHRKDSVETEAFYVTIAVKEDKTREVLGIFNRPSESSTGWQEMFESLQSRGVRSIGLLVADGLKYLEDALARVYPKTPLQKCVTHLKRNMLNKVRHSDKEELSEDLREVFQTGNQYYTGEQAWNAWQQLCEKWGKHYRTIKKMKNDPTYRYYFTYLNYDYRIQSMIYTTNWIERLQRDFRRVLRMRGAMPNEESVIVLMAKTAMEKRAYFRQLPGIDRDKTLFPGKQVEHPDLINKGSD